MVTIRAVSLYLFKVTRAFTDAGIEMEYESGGVVSKQFFARQ